MGKSNAASEPCFGIIGAASGGGTIDRAAGRIPWREGSVPPGLCGVIALEFIAAVPRFQVPPLMCLGMLARPGFPFLIGAGLFSPNPVLELI